MARGTYELDNDKVRRLALDKGLSLEKLSDKAGVSQSVLVVNRTHYPNSIKKIADALGVKPKDIIKE